MALFQNLPDEILHDIVTRLPVESAFCLARTCHTFRRLSYETCYPMFFYGSARCLYSTGRLLNDEVETSVDMFNPPDKCFPPWPQNGLLKGPYHGRQKGFSQPSGNDYFALHSMTYDIHEQKNQALSRIAGLLLKDTLCSSCWDLRGTPVFHQRLRSLMRPRYCTVCRMYHPKVHFSKSTSTWGLGARRWMCLGWTGKVRICAHKELDWKEYQQVPQSFQFNCTGCSTTFSAAQGHIRKVIPLGSLGDRHENPANLDSQLTPLRHLLEDCKESGCPHFQVNDPDLRTYIMHTIRTFYPKHMAETPSPWTEVRLRDCGGKPWNCPICKTTFSIRCVYPKGGDEPDGGPLDILLVSFRPITSKHLLAHPSDSRWLAQLEPSGAATRTADGRGITWCDDASCGTSKNRRKEALLIRMLEIGTQTYHMEPAHWPRSPGERSDWLWMAFRWFWTNDDGEDCQMRDLWRLNNQYENYLLQSIGVLAGRQRWGWTEAAAWHAAILHDHHNPEHAGSRPDRLVVDRLRGEMRKYKVYLKGERRSLREVLWEGVHKVMRIKQASEDHKSTGDSPDDVWLDSIGSS
ncbi:hypothetical protein PGQ11_010797 [Apiospora arundinis]|uniref:F-box domain-containing protein n=1 Tax=Apiospora arundinis TaxID=335852 RepID=A0ABR2IAQ0_9PEZI